MPEINFSYEQLPSQEYLHKSPAQFKAMFGGFGSGKTRWLIYEALKHCADQHNNYFVFLRKTYPELNDTVRKDFFEYCPKELIEEQQATKGNYKLINGTWIVFRSFDALSKIFSYNLGGFAIDQAEELPEDYFLALVSRLRRAGINRRVGLLSLNPAGHNWVWRRFIKGNEDHSDPDYDYALAKSDENRFLPPGYVDTLRKMYPPQWVARYVDCSFDEFEGMVYEAFDDKKNIIQSLPKDKLPKDSPYNIVTIDIGVDNPTAVSFSYFDTEACKLRFYDYIYERGLTVKQISNLIKAKQNKWQLEKVWKHLIDPDALKRQMAGQKNKPISILQDFRANGIPVMKADNNVDYGILRVNELFETGVIEVLDTVTPFFEEIYEYVYRPMKGVITGEINSPGKPLARKNHFMDDIRYTALAIPLSWTAEKREEMSEIWHTHFASRFSKIKRAPSIIRHTRRLSPDAKYRQSQGGVKRWQKKQSIQI